MYPSIPASDSYRSTALIIQRHEAFMRAAKREAAAARRQTRAANTRTSAVRLLPNADARPIPPPAPIVVIPIPIPIPVAPCSSPVPSLSFLPATLFPVAASTAAAPAPVAVVPTPLGSAFSPRPATTTSAMDENTVIPPTDDDETDDDDDDGAIEGETAAERHARLIGLCETDTEDEVEPQQQQQLMHV